MAAEIRRLRTVFFRHLKSVEDSVPTNLFYEPLDGSDELLRYKGMLYRSGVLKREEQKVVGVIGSGSRAGQAAQAAGSIALPGNISPARSPVRSGIARALTPGGGSGRGAAGIPGKPERGWRCPEGFQFGGRFTDENFSTCGKQLFDIPSLRETIGQAVYRTRGYRSVGEQVEGQRSQARTLTASSEKPSDDIMVRRAANVPVVGNRDDKKRTVSANEAVEAVQNQDGASALLVRRDGYVMVPVVSAEELRGVPDNRNMEEAVWVQSVRDPDQIGKDELGFLSNTGVTTLTYVTPNGVQLTLDRTRDLSTGERRQLGKDVNTAADMSVDDDPAARLKFLAEESDGAFKFSQDFGDVKNPEGKATSGEGEGKANWVVGAFIDSPEERVEEVAEPDEQSDAPAADAPVVERVAPDEGQRIESVKEAVEHINKGGLLADIDPAVVIEALKKSDRYKARKLNDDVTLFEAEDGQRILMNDNPEPFEHLSAHFSSEILREMGVQAPAVRFAGEGPSRPFLYRSPDGVIEGAELLDDVDPEGLPPDAILGTQFADYLTDTRDRSNASVLGVQVGDVSEAVVTVGPLAALIGLNEGELEERRNIGVEEFFEATRDAYGRNFEGADDETRSLMLEVVEALLERAREFNFDDYRQKLQSDGILSEAEESHLEIVQGLYEDRLENLNSSKDAILQVLGLS